MQAYIQEEPFKFPHGVDLAAIFMYSMSGVLAGMRRGYDLIGVFTLALVVGTGGGLIRDGIFLQLGPPALTLHWHFLPAIVAACLAGWILNHWIVRLRRAVAVLDAVGLSIFSVIGLLKAIEAGLSMPASILVGVVNASGGGLLRDVLTREEPLMLKPGQFYVLASVVGCIAFVLLASNEIVSAKAATLIAMLVIFAMRMLAIKFNWRTVPLEPLVATPSGGRKQRMDAGHPEGSGQQNDS